MLGMVDTMLQAVLVLVATLSACSATGNGSRHAFYRNMWGTGAQRSDDSRRVFGGKPVPLSMFPGTCVLLDRYWNTRCSGTVVAPNWAVTAGHCVSPGVAYVKYNTRRPSSDEGVVAAVIYMYAHPGFKVVEEDEGRGVDVTQLHHDVGLVRTRFAMRLSSTPGVSPITAMPMYDLETLHDQKVQVLGFGRTERTRQGEELFEVQLRLVACDRAAWEHCACGVGVVLSGPGARGVCSGDSGAPVLYRDTQVGVTSMGPIECATGAADIGEGATSVFTAIYPYVPMLNSTIHNMESALRMRRISVAASASHPSLANRPVAALLVLTGALAVRRAR